MGEVLPMVAWRRMAVLAASLPSTDRCWLSARQRLLSLRKPRRETASGGKTAIKAWTQRDSCRSGGIALVQVDGGRKASTTKVSAGEARRVA